jgi:Flp pilus assembly protein TadG
MRPPRHPDRQEARQGLAATEMAILLPLVMILLFGIWDVGRIVEVQQMVSNAAREGARQAAIGSMLDPVTGAVVNISSTDVEQVVTNYLTRNGVSTTGLVVEYANVDSPAATEPSDATYLQHLRVTVQLPFSSFQLLLVDNFINSSNTGLTAISDWYCQKDVNVTVSTSIPTN